LIWWKNWRSRSRVKKMEIIKLNFFFLIIIRKVKKKVIKNIGNIRNMSKVESGGTRII